MGVRIKMGSFWKSIGASLALCPLLFISSIIASGRLLCVSSVLSTSHILSLSPLSSKVGEVLYSLKIQKVRLRGIQ